jgi:predicted transcriptional regulator
MVHTLQHHLAELERYGFIHPENTSLTDKGREFLERQELIGFLQA